MIRKELIKMINSFDLQIQCEEFYYDEDEH